MAAAVISSVVANLKPYTVDEASLYMSVDNDVRWLQSELGKLLCFLQDADTQKKEGNEEVDKWLRNIQGVAYDAEDVIETYILEADNFPSLGTFMIIIKSCSTTPKESFKNIYDRCIFPVFNSIWKRYAVGRDIRGLKARMEDISARRLKLNIAETEIQGSCTTYDTVEEPGSSLLKAYDATSIVGLEKDKKIIVENLQIPERRRIVVSIVGMGGLGKTTLARKVYHSKEIKDFGVHAWVYVSQHGKLLKILKDIIEKITNKKYEDDLNEGQLRDQLHEILKSKGRYLIILDDVWDEKLLDQILSALPDARNKSRVIVTTRNAGIARYVDPDTDPYLMPFLEEEESKELFLKHVYRNVDIRTFRNDLRVVGEQLVKKCQGLALALEVLGGLVSRKERNPHHWKIVLQNLDWDETQDGACLKVLGVSYYSLPHYLKPCFLYIGCFPEDSNINARQLMELWFAEGFVHGHGYSKLEALLEELTQRSLIQVAERRWDGSVKTIRIHDLLREFCIKEAEEYGFLLSKISDQPISLDIPMTRRLALNDSNSYNNYINPSNGKWRTPKLRTLLNFSLLEVGQSYNGLTLLRVIDMRLEDPSAKIPKDIACLIHLRYLRWWGSSVIDYRLIRNLCYLQMLDVRPSIVNTDGSIGRFGYLRFLGEIGAGMWIENGLAKMTNLQRLKIKELDDTHWKMFVKSLENLGHLLRLSLSTNKYSMIPTEIIATFSRQKLLCVLKLDGMLDQHFHASAFSHRLTKLTLKSSNLKHDPMSTLKILPNLVYLKLRSAYRGTKMSCDADGFPQLQHLTLDFLPRLAKWKVSKGALRSLTYLTIQQCTNLEKVPGGLRHISTLQELKLSRMPPHFIRRVQDSGSRFDYYKVQHIPSIIVSY